VITDIADWQFCSTGITKWFSWNTGLASRLSWMGGGGVGVKGRGWDRSAL